MLSVGFVFDSNSIPIIIRPLVAILPTLNQEQRLCILGEPRVSSLSAARNINRQSLPSRSPEVVFLQSNVPQSPSGDGPDEVRREIRRQSGEQWRPWVFEIVDVSRTLLYGGFAAGSGLHCALDALELYLRRRVAQGGDTAIELVERGGSDGLGVDGLI